LRTDITDVLRATGLLGSAPAADLCGSRHGITAADRPPRPGPVQRAVIRATRWSWSSPAGSRWWSALR